MSFEEKPDRQTHEYMEVAQRVRVLPEGPGKYDMGPAGRMVQGNILDEFMRDGWRIISREMVVNRDNGGVVRRWWSYLLERKMI